VDVLSVPASVNETIRSLGNVCWKATMFLMEQKKTNHIMARQFECAICPHIKHVYFLNLHEPFNIECLKNLNDNVWLQILLPTSDTRKAILT